MNQKKKNNLHKNDLTSRKKPLGLIDFFFLMFFDACCELFGRIFI